MSLAGLPRRRFVRLSAVRLSAVRLPAVRLPAVGRGYSGRRGQLHSDLQAVLASDHYRIEYWYGTKLEEHRETVCKLAKRTTTVYRWLSGVPLRATEDALKVDWFSFEIFDAKGKRTYHNSFVTDLPVRPALSRNSPPAAVRGGRSRTRRATSSNAAATTSRIILETVTTPWPACCVVPNLLAFAYHTAASISVLAPAFAGTVLVAAVAAKGATYRFFEHLRTIMTYVVFQNWAHFLRSIGEAAI